MHRTGASYPQNCMMEAARYAISELHSGKFPDPDDFQCWKTNVRTEVCSCSGCPTVAVSWIKEVEMAKSVDDLMTSQVNRRTTF